MVDVVRHPLVGDVYSEFDVLDTVRSWSMQVFVSVIRRAKDVDADGCTTALCLLGLWTGDSYPTKGHIAAA